MTTRLAIETLNKAPGKVRWDRAQPASVPVQRGGVAAPAIGGASPTVGVAVSRRSAPRAYRRAWRSRYGTVDGIVTVGTIIGFNLALALMAGEWLLAPAVAQTQPVATAAAPAAAPQVAAGQAIEPRDYPKPL